MWLPAPILTLVQGFFDWFEPWGSCSYMYHCVKEMGVQKFKFVFLWEGEKLYKS